MAGRSSRKRAPGATARNRPTSTAAAAAAARRSGSSRPADPRRWIYGGLDLLFGAVFAIAVATVIPSRLLSAAIHLWSLPACALAMGAGTLLGGRRGWWLAVGAGSALLLSTILLIVRVLISAAFLAGVYGAFGRAAATFALVVAALVVEVVALLPIVQIKYLMSRAGRRAYGV